MSESYADVFVGSMAIALGLTLLVAAVSNWSWFYTLRSSRWLEAVLAHTGARIAHAVMGSGLIALGWAIMQGFRWQLLG